MSEIMRYGIESMAPELRERLSFPKSNDGEMQILVNGQPKSETSRRFAGQSARGGTKTFLWVSEWGPIAAEDPRRSTEIRTGALPSARRGRQVVETTWYGGKTGDLWDLVKPIYESNRNARGRVLFFPWHGDPSCVKAGDFLDEDTEEYFRELGERLGKRFSREQKRWYASAKIEQGIFVTREYPSTIEEAMTAPMVGSIYGPAIARRRAEGALGPIPPEPNALVHTCWDLGSPINTVCWYVQLVGREVRLIDVDVDVDMTVEERVKAMLAKGYRFGFHYLPHDAAATEYSGRTFASDLEKAGLMNLRIVPRTADEWIGINHVRQTMLPRMSFRLPHCDVGVSRLENFRTERTTSGGMAKDKTVHDTASHSAAALRTLGEADMAGMLETGWVASAFSKAGLQGLMGMAKTEA